MRPKCASLASMFDFVTTSSISASSLSSTKSMLLDTSSTNTTSMTSVHGPRSPALPPPPPPAPPAPPPPEPPPPPLRPPTPHAPNPNPIATKRTTSPTCFMRRSLLAHRLHHQALGTAPVELVIEDLLPRPEIELA